MKRRLSELVTGAVRAVAAAGGLPEAAVQAPVQVERTRDARHGDYACNVALALARAARRRPREIAEAVVAALPASPLVARVEIAGPGFINFFLAPEAFHQAVREALEQGEAFGRSRLGAGRSIQVEFVSANPTGPLHVGHGRGAAYGAAVAALLEAVGFEVQREYYVNDAGRQMDILAVSVWMRYLELAGETLPFPANGYRGDYVWDIAATLHRTEGDALRHPAAVVLEGLPADEPEGGDREAYIDALIARAKALLGPERYRQVYDLALDTILDDIRRDLEAFGVTYDAWFSERALVESGAVDRIIARLQAAGHVYERDGALWFRATAFGDEKDRVLVRDNGLKTYFATDIAYHADKLERGFERVIDVWGADHHGYVPRVKAALAALGDDPARLEVLLVQFAVLYRGGEKVQMSTRSGEFVTLRELREEVGRDAARFFYVMRRCEQHLDFDLDLAKSQSADNPVYYVQYAHARIHSVLRQLEGRGGRWDRERGLAALGRLTEAHEARLLRTLARYPEVVEEAALAREPHQLAHYLRELANDFHTCYNAVPFLVEDEALRDARLAMILAVRQAIANGLALLGVSAPEQM
ncbi:arginine--tRNA ligase [Inmirania thermothiophila]|uniref:Arginine--tRNA ligase n=1 Tax=Inmirania thermothiophila TaxID=1750597 RepID=A0A3N1Y677_9GAMM|nr:arginine--tRNA ligase [Inmirania thermothiophila]ROR34314.1 arginyl-tRNA synthetase [Inmirania thermothiophila]